MKKHILLIGFMGSGKSTVGKLLAEALNRPFLDSDAWIENKTNKLVKEIFSEEGESQFRELETEFLVELKTKEPAVVALGGGLPCFKNNMDVLLETGTVYYLNSSLLTLIKRLKEEREIRPLIASLSDKELHPTVEALLSERVGFYKRAHVFIPNEGNNPEKAVNDILKEVVKRGIE